MAQVTAISEITAVCSACDRSFHVELAAQILGGSERRFACSPECRERLRAGSAGWTLSSADSPPAPPVRKLVTGAAALRPARCIAVFNHKGGTGKTTTSLTLAAGLAAAGRRVLLVDADPQGSVAASLGLRVERTLYHVLVAGLPPADVILPVRPNLDLLPANESLAAAELYLAGRQARETVLSARLSKIAGAYDYVLLDCTPSLSLLNQNVFVFADSLLCPVACDYLSLVAVRQVVKTLERVNRMSTTPLQLWGVLPTFFDARVNICREALRTLEEQFGDRCLPPIRVATRVKEAPARGQTLFEHAARSSAAEDYCVIVDRLLSQNGRVAQSA